MKFRNSRLQPEEQTLLEEQQHNVHFRVKQEVERGQHTQKESCSDQRLVIRSYPERQHNTSLDMNLEGKEKDVLPN